MNEDLADLTSRRARPYRVPLLERCSPERLVSRLRAADLPAVLSGRWFGGGVLVLRRPLLTHTAEGDAAFASLAGQPRLDAAGPGTDPVVGGGWLACLGFAPGTSALAYYDSLLRWQPGSGWAFEALGLDGRTEAEAAALAAWRTELSAAAAGPGPSGQGQGGQGQGGQGQVGQLTTVEPPDRARDRYLAGVEDAIGRIHRGDFYQVNLCTRLRGPVSGEPAPLFARVVAALEPDYAALVTAPDGRAVACFSPELFLQLHGRTVTTSPIKGTAPRSADQTESVELRSSAKDAAENVMIVDLMRHDLAQVSVPGTVAVPELLAVRPHPGVWHLVSTVTAELRAGADVADLLDAAFPPGSVTGAPKSAALRAIGELEPESRGAYTGSIGLCTPTAGAELNVLIRSFELDGDRLQLGVGGGITADSVPIREWYECWHKAAPLAAAAGTRLDPVLSRPGVRPTAEQLAAGVFETVLVSGGRPRRLAAHLARLDRSCRELYGRGVADDLPVRLQAALRTSRPAPRMAARISARPAGGLLEVEVTLRPLGERRQSSALARQNRPDVSWRHKWADRTALTEAERRSGTALPYFTVEDGGCWVTETSRGNLFSADADGRWRTPPLDEHLLPGVTRREVLDLMADAGVEVQTARIAVGDLRAATAAFWTSSLSGVVAVTAVDGRPLPSPPALVAELNARLDA